MPMSEISRKLRGIELFAGLSEEQYRWLAEVAAPCRLRAGDCLIREGEEAKDFYVLLDGELAVTKVIHGHEELLTKHQAPPEDPSDGKPRAAHQFTGELALLTDGIAIATVSASRPSMALRYPKDAFLEILTRCPDVMRVLLPAVAWRLKGVERRAHNQATIAALGTLAAGLAHELNNPVTAVARASHVLDEATAWLTATALVWGARSTPQEQATLAQVAVAIGQWVPCDADPVALADTADEVRAWARDLGVAEPGRVADALSVHGVSPGRLQASLLPLGRDLLPAGLEHLGAAVEVHDLLSDIQIAAPRVTALVAAVRSYSNLDRAPGQELVVTDGLEATVSMLRAKLKNLHIVRDYQPGIPKVRGYPAELNQVWTNLLDNAAYAMNGNGTLTLGTSYCADLVTVEIADTGCGIPPESLHRIFQPFYTTKGIGSGTGLGLHLSQQIVTQRHGGSIEVRSVPGNTRVQVHLPIRGRDASTASA